MPKSSTVFIEVSDLKQMCVSGIKCDKRMCLVDLKDVYNIKKYFGNNLICDECLDYLNYTREYSDDHLMRWTAVKTTEYLRLYLRLIEKIGCG